MAAEVGTMTAAVSVLSDLGAGAPVVAIGHGFAGSAAHQALAARLRVIAVQALDGSAESAGRALADWAAEAGLDGVGFLGLGAQATAALWAAKAAGERARSVVLVSPRGVLGEDASLPEPFAVPKAVLIGSIDPGQPRDAITLYRRALPRSNVVLVYAAGADIAADRPDALVSAAGDFLERQGRFAFMSETVAISPT